MMYLRFSILICWVNLFTSPSGQEAAAAVNATAFSSTQATAPSGSNATVDNEDDDDDEDSEGGDKPFYDYDDDYDQQATPKNETNLRFGIVYTWAKWPKWNKCSRPCGGGVQTRIRNCIEYQTKTNLTTEFQPGTAGRRGCFGILKKYRMCNQKACPKADNFRDQQCAAHNEIPFKGELYSWEGYIKENHECEHNCKPVDLNVYTTFSKSVVDGTPCTRPAVYYTHSYRGRAVCVEGICKVSTENVNSLPEDHAGKITPISLIAF